jgi:DNA excision repair protein ERCC-2
VSETSPSHLRFFPYDAPYDHQREAMSSIAGALEEGRDVLFEGATGTGKTLAALAPALEHARETGRTVVITTNVHQQTRQFIEEARAIDASESLRAVVFRGKLDMCHLMWATTSARRSGRRPATPSKSRPRRSTPAPRTT